jgi:hypothetical protein
VHKTPVPNKSLVPSLRCTWQLAKAETKLVKSKTSVWSSYTSHRLVVSVNVTVTSNLA